MRTDLRLERSPGEPPAVRRYDAPRAGGSGNEAALAGRTAASDDDGGKTGAFVTLPAPVDRGALWKHGQPLPGPGPPGPPQQRGRAETPVTGALPFPAGERFFPTLG